MAGSLAIASRLALWRYFHCEIVFNSLIYLKYTIGWPRSGEIDIVESRGNRNLKINGGNIGVQQMGSTLHVNLV